MNDAWEGAEVTQSKPLGIQVCVPESWNEDQTKGFADTVHPCGTSAGWFLAIEGDDVLSGDPSRVPCEDRPGFVHRVLYA